MCRNGYVEQNSVKSTLASSPMTAGGVSSNPYDQKKQTTGGGFDSPSVFDLVENSPSSSPSLEKFYNTQEMLMAASMLQPNGYPISSLDLQQSNQQLATNSKVNSQQQQQQAKDQGKQEKAQGLASPSIDRRSQTMTIDNLSLDQNNNSQKLELPIDERSVDGKIDLNSTEGVLEVNRINSIE